MSGKSLDELRAGERVAVLEGKQDPLDFVLWKSAKPSEPDDAKWDSAYGMGRPGWHIECSAMCGQTLGETIDIHGGGADLQFPHHENEIAQSEGANGKPLARFWVHNGFVRVDNEKMSKSLGNFFTIRDVLGRYDAETVRFFLVRAHYRSALNYSDVHLDDARGALKRLYTALEPGAGAGRRPSTGSSRLRPASRRPWTRTSARPRRWPCCSIWPAKSTARRSGELAGLLRALGGCLGLLQGDAGDVPARPARATVAQGGDAEQIAQLIAAARHGQAGSVILRRPIASASS